MDPHTSPASRHGQTSSPPSTKPSLQSRASNSESVNPFSRTSTMSPSQGQMAVYYDGPRRESPPPMVSSPYPVPSRQSTETEDPMMTEFLEWKRLQHLEKQKQQMQKQMQARMQTPEQQQEQQQDQQQQQYQPGPQSILPRPDLPAHLQRMPQRYGSGYDSRTSSMDDYDRMTGNFFPQPYIHAVRPGHTYGKVIARGNAKVLMGNGISNTPTGLERQHKYDDVAIDNEGNLWQGDMREDQIAAFFGRPPRN